MGVGDGSCWFQFRVSTAIGNTGGRFGQRLGRSDCQQTKTGKSGVNAALAFGSEQRE